MQTREGEKAGTRGALSLQGVWSCEFSVTEPSPVPRASRLMTTLGLLAPGFQMRF